MWSTCNLKCYQPTSSTVTCLDHSATTTAATQFGILQIEFIRTTWHIRGEMPLALSNSMLLFLLDGTQQYGADYYQQQGQAQSYQQPSAVSSYTYDPNSGYYYDSSTGLYYDANTGVSSGLLLLSLF